MKLSPRWFRIFPNDRVCRAASRSSRLFWVLLVVGGVFTGNAVGELRAQAASQTKILRAGAATSNITPQLGVILDGAIGQNGPALAVHDEIHARCLALDDGETRLVFVICDTTMIGNEVLIHAKQLIQKATGLDPAHVVITATHTHSTPRAIDLQLGPLNDDYNIFFAQRVADGVKRAIHQLMPARIGWGRGQKPEFLQNRRSYVAPENVPPTPFGTKNERVVMNAPPAIRVGPSGPVDPEVAVLSVQHADGRPLAVLANYGLHYVGGHPRGTVSADYFGAFCDELQRLLKADRQDPPFVGLMANGTSGDVNMYNDSAPRPGVPVGPPGLARIKAVGASLAREVQRVCAEIEYQPWVRLQVATSQLELGVRKPDAERQAWAARILANVKDPSKMSRPQIYAREAQFLAKYSDTVSLPLQVFQIGELGVVMIPCEVFAVTGLAIKKASPAKATFVMELANGYYGYLPTAEQHELGGYETWPARSAFLETAAESKIRTETLRLLRELSP